MLTLHDLLAAQAHRFEREAFPEHDGDKIFALFQEKHDALIVEVCNRAEATCLWCANSHIIGRKSGYFEFPLPELKSGIADGRGIELLTAAPWGKLYCSDIT
jgi:hypothetical protein